MNEENTDMDSVWNMINVGDDFKPIEYVVTEDMVNRFAEAVDDHDDWYMKDSPFGGRIAHPTMSSTDQDAFFISRYGFQVGLHAKHSIEFVNPAIIGKKITGRATIVEKYEKRGKHYVTMEYIYTDEDGREIVRHRKTDVFVLKA